MAKAATPANTKAPKLPDTLLAAAEGTEASIIPVGLTGGEAA